MSRTKSVEEHTRKQLQLLKWGMMFAPLVLLAPYAAYKLLGLGIHWREVLLDTLVLAVGSFVMMQVSFSIIFRLYTRSIEQEQALRENEARYQALFEQANDAIFLETENGKIVDVNRRACQLTGYTRSELLAMKTTDLEAPERRLCPAREIYAGTDVIEDIPFETQVLRRDGSLMSVEITVAPLTEGEDMLFLSIIRDITSRAEVERSLQHRNLELAALNAVAQALSSSLELQDILDEALSSTVRAMGFTGGLIALAGRTGDLELFSHLDLPLPLAEYLESHGMRDTLCDFVYRERKSLGLEDLRTGAPIDVSRMLEAGVQSWAGAPIIYQDRTLGTFCLFDTAPHSLSESDDALLTVIGQQIGIAMENARLFGDAVREREVARTLLNTAETLSTTLRLDKLLERALDELQRVVPYDAASISMLRDERCWNVASRGLDQAAPRGFTLKERPLVQRVVRGRGPVIVSDVRDEPDWILVEGTELVRSWMGMPLISKGEIIGVLMIDSHHTDAYSEGTTRLAFAFAQQVALAIENSRLYEQTRAQLRETTLLHSVTSALSSTLDMGQILPYVARSLCEILNSTSVEIYSLDEEAQTISIVAEYATSTASEKERRSTLGQSYALADFPDAAETLAQRHPIQVRVDDIEADPHERARLEGRDAQVTLLLPAVAGDRVLGFVQVWESQSSRHFTNGEIATGQTLIHQAAVSMENARLFAETQRRVRDLRLLHDVGLAAAYGVRLEETMQAAAEALVAELADARVALLLLEPASGDAAHRGRRWLSDRYDQKLAPEIG